VVRQPPGLVCLRDRRGAADQGRNAQRLCRGGKVGSDERRLGRQLAAPGGEVGEVGLICAPDIGDARLDQGDDLIRTRSGVALVRVTARKGRR
jgi:hypothetical protein